MQHRAGRLTETRKRLLKATETLFPARGFEATSVRDLATAAHCNIAAVHDHCGDTAPLYHAAFSRLAKEHREGRARRLWAELDAAGPGASLETGRPARHEASRPQATQNESDSKHRLVRKERMENPMDPTNDNANVRGGAPSESDQPIPFAGSLLGAQRHICAFFHSPDEEYRVLLPFIKEGFEHGEKAFHIVDPKLREEHLRRLESAGIDVAAAEQSGQFELRNWADAYLRDGHFDQDKMMALLQEVLEGARQQGFPLTRLVPHMEWALEDRPGVDDLVEYETRVNYIWHQYKDPVICVYDLAKFGGDIVVDIMRTHPMIIIGGVLQENPFFVPPNEFLRELRERRATQNTQGPSGI